MPLRPASFRACSMSASASRIAIWWLFWAFTRVTKLEPEGLIPCASAAFDLCLYNESRRCFSGIGTISARSESTASCARRLSRHSPNNPIPIYEQDVQGEVRFVYYGETDAGR